MSSEQDYPSIAQLHQKIREKQANVIFAVTNDQVRAGGNGGERTSGYRCRCTHVYVMPCPMWPRLWAHCRRTRRISCN
jgi:hypothetical protein